MANLMVGTQEVQKIMHGTEELTTLAIGEWSFPVGGDDYASKPFTIEITEKGGSWTINQSTSALTRSYVYSKNGGEPTTITLDADHKNVSVLCKIGDIFEIAVQEDQPFTPSDKSTFIYFGGSAKYKVYGNIMSLCYVDYQNNDTVPNNYCFYRLFGNYVNSIVDSENLVLPTGLKTGCFSEMFAHASYLIKAPKKLPATSLKNNCYRDMFNGCSRLTTVPILPATTLWNNCYQSMFYGCTSLTTAPVLPAPTTGWQAYQNMFNGCTNLSYVKCLLTTNGDTAGTLDWLKNVSATGTFVKASGSVWTSGQSGIPDGWTVQEV